MNDTFTVKPATRQGVKPLIAVYSESGCGKTYSALLLARGLVGSAGKIVMIDTESGRGSLYADVLPGGYGVIELREPFTPGRYVSAIDAAEQSGAACVIVDSASHEWEGAGGILDMAAEIEDKSGKAGLHCWRKPKFEHALFVARLIRSRVPVIACIRAKYKSRQGKNEQGKTTILKDDFTSPIQAEDFIFEATVHAEIMPDHSCRITKVNHPALRACFPSKGPITIENGVALAAWCNGGASPAPVGGATATEPDKGPRPSEIARHKALAGRLWAVTEGHHQSPDKAAAAKELESWLLSENLLDAMYSETLAGLTNERLEEIVKTLEARKT